MLDSLTQQALLDAIPAAAVIVDESGEILTVNRAWARFSEENGGDLADYYIGRNYIGMCESADSDDTTEASVVARGLREVLDGGEGFRCEYPCHSATELRWFEVQISPLETGGRRLVLIMHHDITRRRREQDAVRRAEFESATLAALVTSSPDAIISFDLDGTIVTWNAAASRLYGYTADEIVGRSMETLYPEGWPMRVSQYRDIVIAGEATTFEVVRRTKAGDLRDIAVSAAPVRGVHGDIVAIQNIHRDITEDKASRDHLAIVTRELTHRAKNLLAIIVSIQRQTARAAQSYRDFDERFSARLHSLEASMDLLAAQNWGRVALDELARSQLSVFADLERDQVAIAGPRVMLDAEAVEAIGMTLHELGTNALKHGALSSAGGRIRLEWAFRPGSGAAPGPGHSLVVTWTETSPAISGPPPRTGFGHAVVTRIASQKLGAQVDIDFSPGQLLWRATLAEAHFTQAR